MLSEKKSWMFCEQRDETKDVLQIIDFIYCLLWS